MGKSIKIEVQSPGRGDRSQTKNCNQMRTVPCALERSSNPIAWSHASQGIIRFPLFIGACSDAHNVILATYFHRNQSFRAAAAATRGQPTAEAVGKWPKKFAKPQRGDRRVRATDPCAVNWWDAYHTNRSVYWQVPKLCHVVTPRELPSLSRLGNELMCEPKCRRHDRSTTKRAVGWQSQTQRRHAPGSFAFTSIEMQKAASAKLSARCPS